jgi:hypothetical protein
MVAREFGFRTGNVDEQDYDMAIVLGLGAVLDEEKNQYYLPLADACGEGVYVQPEGSEAPEEITRALVTFKQSEPTHTEFDLPAILIVRDDVAMARQRDWSPTEQYRLPALGATPVSAGGCLGWNCYETKDREWQFDFSYTIECWSRYRVVAQVLHQMVMRQYPPYGSVTVRDSLNVERVYHTFMEGTADLTEINSLVDRIVGLSVSLRVEGELTLDRIPQTSRPFTGPTHPNEGGNPGEPGGPFDPSDPDPGDGGLYGSGEPCKRVTVIGSDE